jgi:2-dehydropantoate 2-reductase
LEGLRELSRETVDHDRALKMIVARPMNVLVVGARVIGSFNAARLKEAGHDVSLLARTRLEELREHGVVLEHYRTGRQSITHVPLVERLEPEDTYDLAIVVVRRNQVASILPTIARNPHSQRVIVGNNAAGARGLIAAVGPECVFIGLANAGDEPRGPVVRYVWSRWCRRRPIRGMAHRARASKRSHACSEARAHVQKHMDAYLKTHAAGLPPFAGALYSVGGDIHMLPRMRSGCSCLPIGRGCAPCDEWAFP